MTVRLTQWTIDVLDVELMASFWSAALGYRTERGDDGAAKLYPSSAYAPTVWLQPGGAVKRDKNRNHPDLTPAPGTTVDEEVERLIALGARRVDIGQTGDEPFEVLADPEGNEFCVLHP
ncbi:VOC family protein [Catenuloplanes atrovinosus]|uniref:Enzyme related to lactoylglutathione lyase n=1 Tax=Catenuloplanes atrovinosus TaxID=137266 RepID=A0AAE3YHK8_9ACTN|nr:VOC family protein [Catenuloplanes atrovinosus]MDR7273814.1 putative enzyme related to lactoylglutathione lyase [Catenuloplanes atrovinosus]